MNTTQQNAMVKEYYRKMRQAESKYWNNKTEDNFKILVACQQNYVNIKKGVK